VQALNPVSAYRLKRLVSQPTVSRIETLDKAQKAMYFHLISE
jgi:hypothetical protein